MFMLRLVLLLACFSFLYPASLYAGQADLRLQMIVLPHASVNKSDVTLEDVSRFSGNTEEYGDLITALKKIHITTLAQPRSKKVIQGEEILKGMRQAGIAPNDILYSVPNAISIERSGRVLKKEEVLSAVQEKLQGTYGAEQIARNVIWEGEHLIPLGDPDITVELLGQASKGKLPVRCSVKMDQELASQFLATVAVDDWRAIPVLKMRLQRGDVVSQDDLQLVRANLAHYPVDIAMDFEQLVGRRVKRSLAAGGPVRRSEIDIPPLVESGTRVKVIYASGGFRAVAQGVAMEDGSKGDSITVRNTRSNKMIRGRIKSAQEIEVIP